MIRAGEKRSLVEMGRTSPQDSVEPSERTGEQTETLLRLAVEAGGVGLWEWELATGQLSWNDRVKVIFGLPVETKGLTLDDFLSAIHPADRAETERSFREALASRTELDHEYRIVRSDGTVRWIAAIGRGLYDAQGEPERMLGASLDITERKQAEAALRESEHVLAESQSIAKLGSWRWDIGGPIRWTAETYRIHGVSPERFVPTLDSGLTLIHVEDRAMVQRWLEACAAGERPGEQRFRAILPDGSERTLIGRGQLTCDPDGRPLHMTGTVQDVTERQRTEDALSGALRKLDTTVNNLSGFVYRCANQPERPVEFVSEGIFELVGYRAAEFASGTKTLGSVVVPADRDRVWSEVQAAVEARRPFVLEYRVTTASGLERWVWEKGAPVIAAGVLVALEGFVTDITERKQAKAALQESEARYRTLFESAPVGIFISDAFGDCVDANAAGCRMLGYTREELLGSNIRDVVVGEEAARVGREQALLQVGEVVQSEWQVRRKDGTLFPAEVSATLLADGRVLCILSDGSERQRAQRESEESRERLQRLAGELLLAREHERAAVAREIHDELGQLLTGLKLDAAWLGRHLSDGESVLGPKVAEMAALVDEAVRSVRQVAARLRPGVLDDLGLPAALERHVAEVRSRSGLRCALENQLGTLELSPSVSIALFRIAQECFTNIARHAQASTARALLGAVAGELVLEISDDGRGISEEEIRTPRSIGITGMRERAALVGGTCTLTGEPGRGTTVRVAVPLSVARNAT